MKITVKIFGTLSGSFPGYQVDEGLALEMAEGSTIADLLTFLNLSGSQGETVLSDGRILSHEKKLTEGMFLQIFQLLHGG